MDLCIERQANQASVISEECAVGGESAVMLSFPLHLSVAQNEAGVSTGQHSVGIPKVPALLRKDSPQSLPICYSSSS